MFDNRLLLSSRKVELFNRKLYFNDFYSSTLCSINIDTGEMEPLLSSYGSSVNRSIYRNKNELLLFSSIGKNISRYDLIRNTLKSIDIPQTINEGTMSNWSADYIENDGILFFHWVDGVIVIYDVGNDEWDKLIIPECANGKSITCEAFKENQKICFPIEAGREIIVLSISGKEYYIQKLVDFSENECIKCTYYYNGILWILSSDSTHEYLYRYNGLSNITDKITVSPLLDNCLLPYDSMIVVKSELWLLPSKQNNPVKIFPIKKNLIDGYNFDDINNSSFGFVGEVNNMYFVMDSISSTLYTINRETGEIYRKKVWMDNKSSEEWLRKEIKIRTTYYEGLWGIQDLIGILNDNTDVVVI